MRLVPQSWDLVKMLSAVAIAVALVTGVGLRVARLDKVPPALHQDEACAGYDAYSILKTGRDHHGNFMPIELQGFNDYHMPLFAYSLVPLVGAFGLKPAVVRLGAAIWGVVDLAAITLVAGLMLGWPGAAAAALIGALMPWHLEFSRFGMEAMTGSATISLAVASFFLWLDRRRDIWLLLSCSFFGLSLYSYAITKATVPLLIGLLATLYWRELKQARVRAALVAAAIASALALPQAVLLVRSAPEMQAQYHHLSLFNLAAICPRCDSEQAKLEISLIPHLLAANFASYFTPSFLFLKGDLGDHWTMVHPTGFGELLPEQAPLVVLAMIALLSARRRRVAILILGWLVFAALPATLITPLGASFPEPGPLPTPHVLFDYHLVAAPVTPSLLLTHPDARHDLLAIAPWILLSALGFLVLLDLTSRAPAIQVGAVGLLLAGVIFHSGRFVRSYFVDFPTLAAPYFQYGIEEFIRTIDQRYGSNLPVVITPRINQPYIYVLFFERYPPVAYQNGLAVQPPGLFQPVLQFDRYSFVPPNWVYRRLAHGIFVFRGDDETPKPSEVLVRYPDGRVAYQIVVK